MPTGQVTEQICVFACVCVHVPPPQRNLFGNLTVKLNYVAIDTRIRLRDVYERSISVITAAYVSWKQGRPKCRQIKVWKRRKEVHLEL